MIGRRAGAGPGREGSSAACTAPPPRGREAEPFGRHPPPPGASFGPWGDVSPSQVSVASFGSASGQDPGKLRSLKDCLDAARTLFGAASGRMGVREGSGKPGNLCTLAKFYGVVWSSGSTVVRRCTNACK